MAACVHANLSRKLAFVDPYVKEFLARVSTQTTVTVSLDSEPIRPKQSATCSADEHLRLQRDAFLSARVVGLSLTCCCVGLCLISLHATLRMLCLHSIPLGENRSRIHENRFSSRFLRGDTAPGNHRV